MVNNLTPDDLKALGSRAQGMVNALLICISKHEDWASMMAMNHMQLDADLITGTFTASLWLSGRLGFCLHFHQPHLLCRS